MASVFFITVQAWSLNYGCELILNVKNSLSSLFVFLLFNLVITLIYLLSYRRQPCFSDEQHHQVCKQDFINDIYIECIDDLHGEKEEVDDDDDDDDDDGMDADELKKRADEFIEATIKGWIEENLREEPEW